MDEHNGFDEISVAICDDSALMRNLVSRIISENPNFKIVCKAVNGKMLLDMLPYCRHKFFLMFFLCKTYSSLDKQV